jgi:hypothetical protein
MLILTCFAYAGVAFLTWFMVAFYFGSQVNTLPVADRTPGWIVLIVSVTAGLLWPLAWAGWGVWRAVQSFRGNP